MSESCLHIFGTDKELSGIIPVISCENMIIDRSVVISKPIFSPLSGGRQNPRMLINEMRMQGKTKLKIKYNVRRRKCMTNITNG